MVRECVDCRNTRVEAGPDITTTGLCEHCLPLRLAALAGATNRAAGKRWTPASGSRVVPWAEMGLYAARAPAEARVVSV